MASTNSDRVKAILETAFHRSSGRFLTVEELDELAKLVEAGALAGELDTYVPGSPKDGRTLLGIAASLGHVSLVQALVDAGADPNLGYAHMSRQWAFAPIGRTTNSEAVRLLLTAGADPNGRHFNGDAALHQACSRNDADLVRDLLAAGADPLATNDVGHTAIMMKEGGLHPLKPEIVQMLRDVAAPRLTEIKGQSVGHKKRTKRMHTIGESFGAKELWEDHYNNGARYEVLLVRGGIENVAAWFQSKWNATRWEKCAHTRLIADAPAYIAVIELKGAPWLLTLHDLGHERLRDDAEHLSAELDTEVIEVSEALVRRWTSGMPAEEHDWSEEAIQDPPEDPDEYEVLARQRGAEYNEWLAKNQVLIPYYGYWSTGYFCGVTLTDIKQRDVVRGDILVLREHDYAEQTTRPRSEGSPQSPFEQPNNPTPVDLGAWRARWRPRAHSGS